MRSPRAKTEREKRSEDLSPGYSRVRQGENEKPGEQECPLVRQKETKKHNILEDK